MNPILCSAIIPSRKRVPRLIKTIDSLLANADMPKCIEAIVKLDDDDLETLNNFPWARFPMAKKVISPRGKGYMDMGRFVTEACEAATGTWCFLIDDDSWIAGQGWDTKLSSVPTTGFVAQMDFYHLGGSLYGQGSCGPVGLMWPTHSWKQFGVKEIGSPADQVLLDIFTGHGWKKHILKGTVYRHDRDTEEQLAAQAKL